MPFKNENVRAKLAANDRFKVGRSNVDSGTFAERGVNLPVNNPVTSWAYYECTIAAMLDSGIVVHNRLPQVDNAPDTLAALPSGMADLNLDRFVRAGVNLRSNDQYADIVQRMGHSRYWFRIFGQALRFGYQIPIPGIKTIGGVPAIPYDRNPQLGFNRIFGNYAGVILWHAQWSLWYTTAVPPRSNAIPSADPALHIAGNVAPPSSIQAPISQQDDNAVSSAGTASRTSSPASSGSSVFGGRQ